MPVNDIAITVKALAPSIHYNCQSVVYELWRELRVHRWRSNYACDFGQETSLVMNPLRYFYCHAISQTFMDLESGRPCNFGTHRASENDAHRCSISLTNEEFHSCAQDAYAYLTSMTFIGHCDLLDWNWETYMEPIIAMASNNTTIFPFIALTPALVWRIACILQGEAGGMGYKGMYLVADTMLGHRAKGESWDATLGHYYAYKAPPSREAMQLAERTLTRPWKSSGRLYAYSEEDRIRQGWPKGSFIYSINGFTLHTSESIGGNK